MADPSTELRLGKGETVGFLGKLGYLKDLPEHFSEEAYEQKLQEISVEGNQFTLLIQEKRISFTPEQLRDYFQNNGEIRPAQTYLLNLLHQQIRNEATKIGRAANLSFVMPTYIQKNRIEEGAASFRKSLENFSPARTLIRLVKPSLDNIESLKQIAEQTQNIEFIDEFGNFMESWVKLHETEKKAEDYLQSYYNTYQNTGEDPFGVIESVAAVLA